MKRAQLYNENDVVEDLPLSPTIFRASKTILFQFITTLLWIPVSLVCVPLYLPGLIIWGRPPTIPSWSRFYRYFTATWMEGKPEDNIPFTNRVLVFLIILDNMIKSPVNGVCWFLDELFYHSYHNTDIKNPVFLLSAYRTGSTQMGDYLTDDKENFITPMVIEGMFPYIWVWRLVFPVMKILGLDRCIETRLSSTYGEEFRKRHNFYLFKSDSWELALWSRLMANLSSYLGTSFFKWGFVSCSLRNDKEFPKCFVNFTDLVMKKLTYHRGSPKQRMLIKGHFLFAAKTLEQHYQGVKFITMVRDPVERIRSGINFCKVVRADGPSHRVLGLFPITWRIARDWVVETQISYGEEEMLFHNQSEENTRNKLAISFTSYVDNLTGTLQHIYSFLNIPLPVEMLSKATTLQSSSHNRSARKSTYDPKYNRSLSSVGVDEDKLRQHLADYINWVKELDKNY